MEKQQLEQYMNLGYSSYKIAKLTTKSQTTIRYWIKKYKLKKAILNNLLERKCPKCQEVKLIDNFYENKSRKGTYHSYCKICNSNDVVYRHKLLKQQCIDYLGGKCKDCGYNKYNGALHFHHLDPKIKDFTISAKHHKQFKNLILELDKCVLLCANCHAERHDIM